MTSLYEVLKRSKTAPQLAPDMFTALWAKSITAGKTIELSGQVPLSFKANGEPLLDYLISGNTVQNGTPTESNPVEVVGVGILGNNLYNSRAGAYQTGVRYNSNGDVEHNDNYSIWTIGVSTLSSGTYTFSLNSASASTTTLRVVGFKNGVKVAVISATQLVNMPLSITVTDDYDEIRFSVASGYVDRIMLNAGQTALPYEPYGYYLPVSSGDAITPVYLGEVETTRNIKKLVLTGEEQWDKSENGIYSYFVLRLEDSSTVVKAAVCSHFAIAAITKTSPAVGFMMVISPRGLRIRTDDVVNVTLNDFTSYLARQYATGAPVTVWYILETPETAVVNEPLMKIDGYADTVSYEQAGVQIPTNKGSTTLDVLTAVKPSNVSIKYRV